jgi:hypothetical protein
LTAVKVATHPTNINQIFLKIYLVRIKQKPCVGV